MSRHTLSARVHAAFDQHQLEQKLRALGQAQARVEGLDRRLSEAEQRVAFWDRVNVFTDSVTEEARDKIRADYQQARRALQQERKNVDLLLDELATTFPPLEIWRRIDACIGLAKTDLETRGLLRKNKVRKPVKLQAAVDALAKMILEIYVPGLDLGSLTRRLDDEAHCRDIALPLREVCKADPNLGFEPITEDQLQGLLAGRLLEAGYFKGTGGIARHQQQEQRALQAQQEANDKVSIWASLNVFTDSPEEQQRNALAEQRQQARLARLEQEEARRMELLSYVDDYPPLHLYRQLGAILGVLENLSTTTTYNITASGDVETIHVVQPQALLMQAVLGLRRGFLKVFPGLPMPSLLAQEARIQSPETAQRDKSPRHQLMRDFTMDMDRREAQQLMGDSLHHAAVYHRLCHTRDNLKSEVPLLDRAVFWSDSDVQEQLSLADSRARHHQRKLRDTWDELLTQAREASVSLPPLRIRDLMIAATLHTKAIGTSGGCSVNARRADAVRALQQLQSYMSAHYGTTGTRQSLMQDVAQALTVTPGQSLDPTIFRARSYAEIVLMIAEPLRGSNFREEFLQLSSTTAAWQHATSKEKQAKDKVSFWDWVNVFSKSAKEKERDQFKDERLKLERDVAVMSQRVNHQLNQALRRYPPAQLYYMIDGIIAALQRIYARLETRTTTDSKGRTRTTTTCRLYGKSHAVKIMKEWNRTLVHGFGALPDIHESLLRWTTY